MADQDEIEAKRQSARRARRLAYAFTDTEDQKRALALAAELENQADALELASKAADKIVDRLQTREPRDSAAKDGEVEES